MILIIYLFGWARDILLINYLLRNLAGLISHRSSLIRLFRKSNGVLNKNVREFTLRSMSVPLSNMVSTQEFGRSEEHTSELQSRGHLVCRLLLEKKKSQETKQNKTVT